MKPREPTPNTQPHTIPGSTSIRSFSENNNSSGELISRYDFTPPQGEPIVSWKGGFKGGPDIFVNDPDGKRRPANKGDFDTRPITTSDAGKSEGESSVISIEDLGFSAAPAESLPEFRDFYARLGESYVDSETKLSMNIDELRGHLKYHEGSADTIEQLVGEKIEESFEKSKQDNEDYLPLNAFEAIFGIETIKSLIQEAYSESTELKWERIVAHIVGNEPNQGYRRILGALVLMNQVSLIYDFIIEGVGDYDLPIRRSPSDNKGFETRGGGYNSTLFQGWHRSDIELFYVYQKKLFIPFFDIQEDKLCSYVFDSSVRLPWKDFEQKTSGGNGLVHKVQIHSKHHNFRRSSGPEKPIYFALKEIFTLDRDAYRQELCALEKSTAQAQREKHLIKLLLTFRHGEVCYLLFEWADGNLADFWEQTKITPAPSDTWAIQQCLGVSSAVKRIHGLSTWQKKRRSSRGSESDDEREWGRHGDIKPNNILWFSEYMIDPDNILHHHLVVSDLGLTRYHSQSTRSAVHRSHLEGCTWGYRAPEMDTEHLISSRYDIWSLGCVFLEFCVWYVAGGKAVQIFGIEREQQDKSEIRGVFEDKYFNIATNDQGRKVACLKPIVEEYLDTKLRESNRCTPFVEQMLDLIQRGMLVVEPKERWKIDKVCTEIYNIKTEISKVPSESRPSIELNALQIDNLVHHAQGNSGDILAESGRQLTLSDDVCDGQSPGSDPPLAVDEPTQTTSDASIGLPFKTSDIHTAT